MPVPRAAAPRRRRTAALLVLTAALALTGCGGQGGRAATQLAKQVGAKVRTLPDAGGGVPIPRVPRPPVPRPQLPTLAQAAEEEAVALIAPHVDDLTETEARQVVGGACKANDLIEIGGAESWEDAVDKGLTAFGGRRTLRDRVADLGEDMAEARSTGTQAVQVGAFLVCEVV